jgi:hypothetical protein
MLRPVTSGSSEPSRCLAADAGMSGEWDMSPDGKMREGVPPRLRTWWRGGVQVRSVHAAR